MPVKRHRGEPGQVKSSPNRVSGDSIRLLRTVFVLYDLVDTLAPVQYCATAMHSAFGHRGAASARALRRALDSRSGAARLLAVQAHVSIKYVGGAGG